MIYFPNTTRPRLIFRRNSSRLTEAKSSLTVELAEIRTHSSLASSSAVPLRYELERVRTELDSVKSHAAWLESELTSRTDQASELRSAHAVEAASLRVNLEEARVERDDVRLSLEALQRAEERLRGETERLSKTLRNTRGEAADAARAFEDELVAERRLSELGNEKAERALERYEGLRRDMETTKKLAEAAAKESGHELSRMGKEMEARAQDALEALGRDKDAEIERLKRRVKEAQDSKKNIEDELLRSPVPSRRRRRRTGGTPSPASLADNMEGESINLSQEDADEPMSLTDLYQRLSETEDELSAERTERRRVELFLERIHLDIEQKTPMMRQRHWEYTAAISAQEELRTRLDDALAEAEAAKEQARAAQTEMSGADFEFQSLRKENTDLATQVQALLQEQLDGSSNISGESTPSVDIVTFGSISELQAQNQRLLREYRTLQDTVSNLECKLESDPLQIRISEAEEELSQLREERERQVTLVKGIVQQRDLYRALLAKNDSTLLASGTSSGGAPRDPSDGTPTAIFLEDKNKGLEEELVKLKSDLALAQAAKSQLEERAARMDMHAAELSVSVDSLRTQISSANAAQARADADAQYNREQVGRLEGLVERVRAESMRSVESKRAMQSVNAQLQKALEAARTEGLQHEQQLRQVRA